MKMWTIAVSAACLVVTTIAIAQDAQEKKDSPKTEELTVKQKASYGIGVNIGRTLQRQGLTEIDPKQLAQGIADAYAGSELRIDEDELQEAIQAFQQELMAMQAEKNKAVAEKNKKEGEAFLAENKKKEGVKTLPSGLQYQVIKEGTGASPKENDSVTTHYEGTLIDGTVFDSSYKRGEPATFPVSGVIKGWTEALQLMKVGSKWRLFVPSELAYGSTPRQGSPIGPNSVLIFDVELLGIDE